MTFREIIGMILSPSYYFADWRKSKVSTKDSGKESRAKLIKDYNIRFLAASMSIAFWIGIALPHWESVSDRGFQIFYSICFFLLAWLIFSRCNEIFYAFIHDALDKVGNKESNSNLKYSERIRLALNSYIELVINFGVIFYLMPSKWFL